MGAYFACLAWVLWGTVTAGGAAALLRALWVLTMAPAPQSARYTALGFLVVFGPIWVLLLPVAAVLP